MKRLSAFATLWEAIRGRRRPGSPSMGESVAALPRLATSTLRGDYPGLDRSRLMLMGLALAYVVSPVDLMPEAVLLLAGLGDDAVVLSWLAGTVLVETERFLDWESAHQRSNQGTKVSGHAV